MRRYINIILCTILMVSLSSVSFARRYGPPVRTTEVDGAPSVPVTTRLIFPNGSVTRNGSRATITFAGAGAPNNATYITQLPDPGLTTEQAMSLLNTGSVWNTTVTGVLSINANNTAFGNLVGAANQLPYFTGVGTMATTAFSADGQVFVAAADYAAMGALLGIGTGDSPSFAGASFTDVMDYDDPTTFTITLTDFDAGNQIRNGDITGLPGDNVVVRRVRVYISTDPGADENDQFRLSFYSDDGYTEDDLLWSDFFNLTYSEVLTAQWNSTDTSGDIDTSAGLVKYDLIRMLDGTPENQRVTAITDADTIAFTALVGNHAVDEGVVRVYEYTDAFMLFDDDDSAEIHVQLENFGTFAASASVVIEVDIQ